MSDGIEFASNYHDLSTDRGFQFEFYCNRCHSGYRTSFKPWAVGTASAVLDTASGLFGGLFGSAATVSDRVRSATWEKAHDGAFASALDEVKPSFVQCPRCSSWVCRESCWNTKRGLCKGCAPDMGVEMSAAQASRSVEEVWAHAAMAEEDKHLDEKEWRETIRATCPSCEAPLATNAKFCPECGAKLQSAARCTHCGTKLNPGAKFCPECGEKVT
jgi:membrane protease subunit (stomatin/prohibitin family)